MKHLTQQELLELKPGEKLICKSGKGDTYCEEEVEVIQPPTSDKSVLVKTTKIIQKGKHSPTAIGGKGYAWYNELYQI